MTTQRLTSAGGVLALHFLFRDRFLVLGDVKCDQRWGYLSCAQESHEGKKMCHLSINFFGGHCELIS